MTAGNRPADTNGENEMGRYSYDIVGSIDPDNDWRHEPGPECDDEDDFEPVAMTAPPASIGPDNDVPVRGHKLTVRFTDFLATSYRGKDLTLAHEGGWWVCVIDDLPHSAHNAVRALKGWFSVWGDERK